MKDAEIQKAVKAIRSIAHAQVILHDADALTPELSREMLSDIVKRCDLIKPGKWQRVIDADVREFVKGVIGFCAATREEEHGIWERFVDRRNPPVTWTQCGGIGVTVGYLDDRPIAVSLAKVRVAGHPVIFYHATSTVVDYDMVRAFIDDLMEEALEVRNHTDAANFANILPNNWHQNVEISQPAEETRL